MAAEEAGVGHPDWRLRAVRVMVDRAVRKLELEASDHPLRRLDRLHLRRVLAAAAWRELRQLRRETERQQPADSP
jgi:hypothetical protein